VRRTLPTLAITLGAFAALRLAITEFVRPYYMTAITIGKFQSVAGKLADMYVRLEAARLLIYRVAWLKHQGRSAPAEAAAAKLFTSEAWVCSSQDAIQTHGGWGYLKDAGIERDLRDAVAGTIYSGTSEIQRVVLARMLGL
jgi:L-prolyl-PCP dehydrogenase